VVAYIETTSCKQLRHLIITNPDNDIITVADAVE